MTDTQRRTVLLAASITDGERYSTKLEAQGDHVVIVTPRTRNRLDGYRATRVLHTPAAIHLPEYEAMHADAQRQVQLGKGRHLESVKP